MNNRTALGLGLLGAGVIYLMRNKISQATAKLVSLAMTDDNKAIFIDQLPSRAKPYGEMIWAVADETGVDPLLIFAIGDRESNWGTQLRPQGPGGTGDFTPRTWGPYPMPPDGQGWGRGLMQIDYYANKSWIDSNPWQDPETNIRKGVSLFTAQINFFSGNSGINGITDGTNVTLSSNAASKRGVAPGVYADPRPLFGEDLFRAAIAAYNTGGANVLMSLAVGQDPDTTSTGADYSADVVARSSSLADDIVSSGGTLA